ncbi:hypothetical protein SAMN05444722_1717 [Rhodovulum sp. ES.010]|uniref:hypothetical protein n=1 Tax=Rhodovulum sp. ES.010 TaxID=1882821 RepID=UPI000927F273|nr:hypothetical protein [Rhodovulum sp. ES.010]SIO36993.1 hypothetical protein SAMN05444722_1717 [Rhodovulum sp. ES.010]
MTRPLDEVVALTPHASVPRLTTRGTLYAALLAEGYAPAVAMGFAMRAPAGEGRAEHGPDDVRAWWTGATPGSSETPRARCA